MRDTLHGHYWTFVPHALGALRPERPPRDEPWDTHVDDPRFGHVRLTGWHRAKSSTDTLVIILHGYGGDSESRYVIRAARAVSEAGLAYLRLNMRGAENSGEDIYHAGLTDDLTATLASPSLARYRRIYLVGFSMGGHLSLRWSLSPARDPRVRAIVTVCAPLDLHEGAHQIQRPLGRPYQWHVLRGLKGAYAAAAIRRPMPVPVAQAMRIRSILAWDEQIIVPRFGFASRAAYYESEAAGPMLKDIELPTLFLAAEEDPIVTANQLRPWLENASDAMEVRWSAGGHVAFPALNLVGDDGPGIDGPGIDGQVEPQIVRWLLRHGA